MLEELLKPVRDEDQARQWLTDRGLELQYGDVANPFRPASTPVLGPMVDLAVFYDTKSAPVPVRFSAEMNQRGSVALYGYNQDGSRKLLPFIPNEVQAGFDGDGIVTLVHNIQESINYSIQARAPNTVARFIQNPNVSELGESLSLIVLGDDGKFTKLPAAHAPAPSHGLPEPA